MLEDLRFVLSRWRVIHLLGISNLRARYARSKFGQLWLSISTLFLILSTGAVWSLIWHMSINDYLPYVGVGYIFYMFISQTITESSGIFTADARLYLNERVPFLTSVMANLYRNAIMFLHNVPTIVLLVLWSNAAPMTLSPLYGVALALTIVFLFASSYIIATLCTCYRDLVQVVGLVMQIVFLVSPVMWKIDFLPPQYRDYIYINPLASFLEVLRNPVIGQTVNALAYKSLLGWDALLLVLMILVYRKFDRSTVFWI